MKCSPAGSVVADSVSGDCSYHRKRLAETGISDAHSGVHKKRKCIDRIRAALLEVKYVGTPMISKSTGCRCDFVRLERGQVYTIGRSRKLCDFVLNFPGVNRQHCKIFFDSSCCKIFIVDGGYATDSLISNLKGKEEDKEEEEKDSGSLNGVFVNGVRCKIGEPLELSTGDEVSLVCSGDRCDSDFKIGFLISKVIFLEERGIFSNHGDLTTMQTTFSAMRISSSASRNSKRIFASRSCFGSLGPCCAISRAKSLLGKCRHILRSADPISCIIRCPIHFGPFFEAPLAHNIFPASEVDFISIKPASPIFKVQGQEMLGHASLNNDFDQKASINAECFPEKDNASLKTLIYDENKSLLNSSPMVTAHSPSDTFSKRTGYDSCVASSEKIFCLNHLGSVERDSVDHRSEISLPELFHPVQSILRIFIATFTSDIEWFLSHCQIPCHLPVIIACHDVDRCWSSSPDRRTLVPYLEFPNVEVVFPPFPESIAFGNDHKKQGIACHHPKLFVVQREDRIRVIITSANLVAKQWVSITNTVWWQDFPGRNAPDYMSLFTRVSDVERCNQGSNSDFAAQLAGFMACLLIDNPRQAYWITELAKYDFQGANGYLITSVPGIHSYRLHWESAMTSFSTDDQDTSCSQSSNRLATVEASIVGLSYFFRTASDSNGATLKKLATFLSNSFISASEMLEIVLRRNTNVAADPNAVSVLVRDPNNFAVRECIQVGFLPRTVAKWVSPLWDGGLFRFSGHIYPKEVLAAALGGVTKEVPLILHVFQGPSFPNIPKMFKCEHMIALCSLIASMERCIGLSRLHEVVGQYSWPEPLETDFVYAASSIGSSVSPQFLAAFSAAAGKKSPILSDSEESDPEWGRWTTSQELNNPSVGIIFPTIERVKSAVSGISPSRQILCFSERTWQRLKTAGILHDAVPHPHHRIGHPMHIKVAMRRFKSRTSTSSFGWVYSGSHNFSAAAWGRPISSHSDSKSTKLHVCNYELGIIFVVPPEGRTCGTGTQTMNLDDIDLPFAVPAPRYGASDRPATKQAMREATVKLNIHEREPSEVPSVGEVDEIPEEEELVEPLDCVPENEEEKAYANMLWSEFNSSSRS